MLNLFVLIRGYINHYIISIQPDKCPRRVNRDIIQTMVRYCCAKYKTADPSVRPSDIRRPKPMS